MEIKRGNKNTRTSNGTGYIYKDKSRNRWRGQVKVQDNPRKTFQGETRKEVEKKISDYMKTVENGSVKLADLTVLDIAERYYTNAEMRGAKPKTLRGYADQIKLRIRPYKISRIKVSKLTLIDCEDWVREMGKDHSDYSVRRAVSELKVFMGYAKTLGIIRENFIGDVSNKPNHKGRGIVVFEVYELNQLLDYASELGKDDYVRRVEYIAINLLAKTGRRRGEVLALKWENVNFDKNEITIAETVNEKIQVGTPKTEKSSGTISVDKSVMKELEDLKFDQTFTQQINNSKNLVFTFNGEYVNPDRLLRRFKILCKAVGIQNKVIHDLRHTFASITLENNVPIVSVSKAMGHAKVSTTLDIYGHFIPKQESVSEIFTKLTERVN
jgi:integrase|tara:strand:- start:664 stop:1812 length:1149 start_codon:yes stop_codon:yes gene_type:complete